MKIEINGLNELLKIAEKFPSVSEKHINFAIQRSLIRIQDGAKRNAPFGTSGQLRNNWDISTGRFTGALKSNAQSNGFYYGSAVEFGTRPHFPPVSALNMWAKKKGINPYVLARSISRKGTKANPFFQSAIDSQQDNVNKEFDNALSAIIKEL